MLEKNKEIRVHNGHEQEMTPQRGETKEMAPYEERTRQRRVYIPRADIYETRDDVVVIADIPGADEKSVDITLEKNVLTINAYPVGYRYQPEGYSSVYSEYGIGDYQRRFVISNEIDQDKIEASVKNGVLHLRLPKSGPAKTRKITVRAN
jgi:HSP20 family molecular chaperone IbpA